MLDSSLLEIYDARLSFDSNANKLNKSNFLDLLNDFYINFECSSLVSYIQASSLHIVVFGISDNEIYIAISGEINDSINNLITSIQLKTKKQIKLFINADSMMPWLLISLKFIQEFNRISHPLDRLIFLLKLSIELRASDIHLETKEQTCHIRLRIDGRLLSLAKLQLKEASPLLQVLKLESSIDITQLNVPQDGRMKKEFDNKNFDFRVSFLPLIHGESMVVRILYKNEKIFSLDSLGLNETTLNHLKKAIHKNSGLILVTGPTGSGKSTTLYALINELKGVKKKLITLEEPVEYDMALATQVEISQKLSFSNALRSVLRQDPDVIMIGEIRDNETLNLALNASLTGHLVIASLHSNDCLATLDRLFELGAESSVVATTLLCVVAQRLVGALCVSCKKEVKKGKWHAFGCEKCNGTGYKSRVVLSQSLYIDENLKKEILANANLKNALLNIQISSIKDDALNKADKIDYYDLDNL